jgi:hypothetical protein
MSRRLLETGSGSRTEAFGAQEWLLLSGIALIWGRRSCSSTSALREQQDAAAIVADLVTGVTPAGRD